MLKPQDIVILVALTRYEGQDWIYERLASDLKMPTSQVFKGLERAAQAHLFVKPSRSVVKRNLIEFLIHGIRYAFAVQPGAVDRGVEAGWDAPGLSDLMSGEDHRVWPDPEGTVRGESVEPLHPSVPALGLENAELHTLLALVDILRVGSARERAVAADELKRRLA